MVDVVILFRPDKVQAQDDIQEIDKEVKQEEKKIQKAKEDTTALRTQVALVLATVNAAVGFVRLFSELSGRNIEGIFAAQLSQATLSFALAVQIAALAGASGNLATFIFAGAIASSLASLIASVRQAQLATELSFKEAQQRELNLQEDF